MSVKQINDTVSIAFSTNDGGVPTAPSQDFVPGDFVIYKAGRSVPRLTSANVTIVTNKGFSDGYEGTHELVLVLVNNGSDPDFYAAGNEYYVDCRSAATVGGNPVEGLIPRSNFKIVASDVLTEVLTTKQAAIEASTNTTRLN